MMYFLCPVKITGLGVFRSQPFFCIMRKKRHSAGLQNLKVQ